MSNDVSSGMKKKKKESHFIKISAGQSTKTISESNTVPSPSLRLLVLDGRPTQSRPHAAPNLRVKQSAQEDHSRAHPVPGSEGVLEVNDGENKAEELSQRHHQSDGEWGALRGQDEDTTDADVPEESG